MKRLLFTFLALCLAVAGSAQSGQMTSKLPTIDITKEYPKKKLVLQDIATAKYIPLETSDKVLLDGVATLHCSFTEHYITMKGKSSYSTEKGKYAIHLIIKEGVGKNTTILCSYAWTKRLKSCFCLTYLIKYRSIR